MVGRWRGVDVGLLVVGGRRGVRLIIGVCARAGAGVMLVHAVVVVVVVEGRVMRLHMGTVSDCLFQTCHGTGKEGGGHTFCRGIVYA